MIWVFASPIASLFSTVEREITNLVAIITIAAISVFVFTLFGAIPHFSNKKNDIELTITQELNRKNLIINDINNLEESIPVVEASLIDINNALSVQQAELDKIKAEQARIEGELAKLS